jgi:hypothetical protein
MNKKYYIGLDVQKETIAIAYACDGDREDGFRSCPTLSQRRDH